MHHEREKTVLKVSIVCKLVGKMKGVHLCIGDSKDGLYFHKYMTEQSKETTVDFPKGGGSYKIGIVKEGVIGFDEFYMLEKETLTRFDINQPETKPAR